MPVYKQGVEDAVKKSLFTTIGDIIGASAAETPARIAAPASGQVFTGQGAGVLPAWAAASAGAVTRAGGNTVEATTTSTSTVDLLSTSSLSIVAATPVTIFAAVRKTTGAANGTRLGLTVNATNVRVNVQASNGDDSAASGFYKVHLYANLANYLRAGIMETTATNFGSNSDANHAFSLVDMPAVTITSLILTAHTDNASVTCGADEMHVYTYAVS